MAPTRSTGSTSRNRIHDAIADEARWLALLAVTFFNDERRSGRALRTFAQSRAPACIADPWSGLDGRPLGRFQLEVVTQSVNCDRARTGMLDREVFVKLHHRLVEGTSMSGRGQGWWRREDAAQHR